MNGVSIQEAAQRMGVAQDTVRRRIRRGEIQAHQEPTHQGFRWIVDDLEENAQTEPMPSQEQEIGDTHAGVFQSLRELVDTLQAQVLSQGEELEARRREVQELHVLLQQTQAALPPAGVSKSWWRRVLGRA